MSISRNKGLVQPPILHIYSLHIPLCIHIPPYVCTPPYFGTFPLVFKHSTYVPILLCASVCCEGFLHVVGGCRGPFKCLGTPTCWIPPHMSNNPPNIGMFSCASVCFRGYLHVIWGIHASCWGLGASAHLSGFGV